MITSTAMNQEIARQSSLSRDIGRLQTAISTGKRLRSPSDDPLAAARIGRIATTQSNDTTWSSNLTLAATLANQADGVIASLTERVTHAQGLMIAATSGTATAADRATYAAGLQGIADDIAALRATRTALDTPLFANGQPASMRVDASTVMTPVAAATDVFEPGGTSLTTLMTSAAAALLSGDTAQIGTALGTLGTAVGHVADIAADQGVRAARIDNLAERNATRSIDLASERSALEDTDMMKAIADLNARQITLDAAQAAFARINRRTLFDMLG